MLLKNAIQKRRSIRKFTSKSVSEKTIQRLVKSAILAPSAKNRQPWKFIVYTKKAREQLLKAMEAGLNRELSGNMRIPEFSYGLADAKNTFRVMKEAPVLIVVLNTNGKSPYNSVTSEFRIVEICDNLSIGAAIQNFILSATAKGLGTLWIANTCFAYEELEKEIGTDLQITGIIALGHPAEKPAKRPRKPFSEIYEYKE